MIRVKNQPLTPFERNVYSQWGEDGVIEEIFKRLHLDYANHLCIDIGAWDGQFLSNTKNLIDNGMSAILVEGNSDRARGAKEVFASNPSVRIIEAFVDENFRLSSILSVESLDIALLNIDIDSDDLKVLSTLDNVKPKLIVIEFNPTIPNHVDFINPTGMRQGNSAKAILAFAESRDFSLIHATSTNLILCQNPLLEEISIKPMLVDEALDDSQTVRAIFVGYDGSLLIVGNDSIAFPWHGLRKSIRQLELPKSIRKFPEEYSLWNKVMFRYFWFLQYWKIALVRRANRMKMRI